MWDTWDRTSNSPATGEIRMILAYLCFHWKLQTFIEINIDYILTLTLNKCVFIL